MSLNISVATMAYLVCATDRRLTIQPSGQVLTEQSTKLTRFTCADATGFVTYNGVGKYQGKSPSEWLLDLDSDVRLSAKPLSEVVDLIRVDTQSRINRLPRNADHRHSFVICAFLESIPVIAMVSNYESVHRPILNSEPKTDFSSSFLYADVDARPKALPPVACVVTGSSHLVDHDRCEVIKATCAVGSRGSRYPKVVHKPHSKCI